MNALPLRAEEVDALLAPLRRYRALVIAVSGGADSTALMHLVADWSRRDNASRKLVAVTVDHGLRAEAAAEAAVVARQAQALGLEHRTLCWSDPKPRTGLQAAAREARYRLMADVLIQAIDAPGMAAIVTAHTADDQAETLLMRLARGSGVDGLAAIPALGRVERRAANGKRWWCPVVRPLLNVPRARLVATLARAGVPFVDDPSNRDIRFERVRVRDALPILEGLGLTREALARTAMRMQSAKAALRSATNALWDEAVQTVLGVVLEIDRDRVAGAPGEIGLRLLRRALGQAGGDANPAELSTIETAVARLFHDTPDLHPPFTIGGCIVEGGYRDGTHVLRIYREPDRDGGLPVMKLTPGETAVWDRRFWASVAPGYSGTVDVGPIGADWPALVARHTCLSGVPVPVAAVRGLPAFRSAGVLVAAPMLAEFARNQGDVAAAMALSGPLEQSCSSAAIAPGPLLLMGIAALPEVSDP